MGGGNADAVCRDLCLLGRHVLGVVQQFARNHATINHNDCDPICSVIQDQGASVDGCVDLISFLGQHPTVDNDRHLGRTDINNRRTGRQFCFGFVDNA